jgi:hypothetical protein
LTARHRQVACASSPRVEIDIENYVQYWDDGRDPSKFATDVNERTTTRVFAAFTSNLHLGDIVAVNGKPASPLALANSPVEVTERDAGSRRDARRGDARAGNPD